MHRIYLWEEKMNREIITLENFSMVGQAVDILNDEGKIVVDFSRLSEGELYEFYRGRYVCF